MGAVALGKSNVQEQELPEAKREILKLKSQLRRTEEERSILKKAVRYFASQPASQSKVSVYQWLHKPLSDRAVENRRLLDLIRDFYFESHGIYGSPRVART